MYTYLLAVGISFFVWLAIFVRYRHLRYEMLVTGGFIAPFVIFDYFTIPSYWNPQTLFGVPVGIEGLFFTFFIAGIASVIFEAVFGKRINLERIHLKPARVFYLTPAVALAALIYYLLDLNIIYFIILQFAFAALLVYILRQDLLKNIVYSAIIFSFIYAICFNLWLLIPADGIGWWNLDNLSGLMIGLMPLEEFLFALGFGALIGPIFEFITETRNIDLAAKLE